jgi:hypothetical protein
VPPAPDNAAHRPAALDRPEEHGAVERRICGTEPVDTVEWAKAPVVDVDAGRPAPLLQHRHHLRPDRPVVQKRVADARDEHVHRPLLLRGHAGPAIHQSSNAQAQVVTSLLTTILLLVS